MKNDPITKAFEDSRVKLPVDYTKLHWKERIKIREQYIDEQEGKCMYCGELLINRPPKKIMEKKIKWSMFPNNFRKYPIHLQHCHKTNMTEGAVHAVCNAVLWQYEGR